MRATGWMGFAAALFLLGACCPRPCCAGGTAESKNVDELVATVEGEFITRRTLIRDVGEKHAEEEERAYELRLRKALYTRAVRRIFLHAGEQIGLTMTPDAVEEEVQWRIGRILDSARAQAEKDKPGSGAKITFDRILKEMGKTLEEFRSETQKDVTIRRYYYVLQQGVTGKRAVVDLEPTPEDLRRLYAAHIGDVSVRRGAQFSFWIFSPVTYLVEDAKPHFDKYDDAVAEAKRQAAALLVDFRRDHDAGRVAHAFGVKDKEWQEVPAGTFIGDDFRAKSPVFVAIAPWLFDPARRTGDSTVIDGPQGTFLAVAMVQLRQPKTLSFDDVKGDLAKIVHQVREQRFRGQHLLGLLARAQVWPTSLAEELEDQQRAMLAKLDEDPVARDIRLP